METMSDSQFEFEVNYDDDFDDDEDDNIVGGEEKERTFVGESGKKLDALNDSTMTFVKSNSRQTINKPPKANQFKAYMAPAPGRTRSEPRVGKKQKKAGNKKGGYIPQHVNGAVTSANQTTVIKRVLSASRRKSATLHNAIYELQQQCTALTLENRDLKRNTRQQDRDLRKLDSTEAQLPAILKKHTNEIDMLSEKYKRQKEMSTSLNDNLKRADTELLKAKDRIKEYQAMVKEKNLGERIELRNKMEDLEKLVAEKDSKISELNRSVLLQKKLHHRALKDKHEKHEKDMEKIRMLEEVQQNLVSRIKDLEKALELTNVYSRRKKDGKEMSLFSTQGPLAPILKKFQEESLLLIGKLEANNSSTLEKASPPAKKQNPLNEKEKQVVRNLSPDLTEEPPPVNTVENSTEEHNDFYNVGNTIECTPVKPDASPAKKEACPESSERILADHDDNETQKKVDEVNKKTAGLELGSKPVQDIKPSLKKKGKPVGDVKPVSDGKNKSEQVVNEVDDQAAKFESVVEVKAETLPFKVPERRQMGMAGNVEAELPILDKAPRTENVTDVKPETLEKDLPQQEKRVDDDKEVKRKLLLARLQAIDSGKNPNNVTESSIATTPAVDKNLTPKTKQTKRPIFLQSSPKTEQNGSTVSQPADQLSKASNLKSDAKSLGTALNVDNDVYFGTKPEEEQKPFLNHTNTSSATQRSRKDSWEFKRTDENLHKGLHAHANMPMPATKHSSQSTSANTSRKNSNAISSHQNDLNAGFLPAAVSKEKEEVLAKNTVTEMGSLRNDSLSKPNGARNRFSTRDEDNSLNSGYLPTMFDSNTSSNKRTKKKDDDLFNQFDDPFKSTGVNSKATPGSGSPGSLLNREKESSREFFPRTKRNSITSDHGVDDLEEMFIL